MSRFTRIHAYLCIFMRESIFFYFTLFIIIWRWAETWRMKSESSSNLYNLNHSHDINQTCFGCEFGEVQFLPTKPIHFEFCFCFFHSSQRQCSWNFLLLLLAVLCAITLWPKKHKQQNKNLSLCIAVVADHILCVHRRAKYRNNENIVHNTSMCSV